MLSREELRRIVMADIGAQEGLRDKHFGPRAEIARAIVNSAIYDHQGEWVWRHWTDEWSPGDWLSNVTLNPDPDLPEPNRASVTWKYELDPAFLAAKENGGELAGVYLDSVASFMGLQCENFRREHWAHADIPLIASPSARKPAQLHCFACYEFAQQVCDEMHRRGKLVIANTFRPYMQFFCHLIDMVGAGEGRRCGIAPHEYYRYLRFYGYRKPISYMDYGFVDPKMAWETKEEGMQLCLLYAVHPGTGGFEQRSSYEPSRALFRHYEPLICWLDEAGWQPATRATVEPKTVVAERYGPGQGRYRGTVFVALHLPKGEEPGQATCKVELTPQELGLVSFQAADLAAWELVQCVPVRLDRQGNLAVFSLELLPGRTRVVAIGSRDALAGLWLSEAGKWLERTAAESRWLAAGQRRDITNGGFERGLDGWGTGPIGGPKEATLTIEEKAPLSGSRSL
ncbi:MAG: hypothetical protein H5T86_15840, partial [Armatimonadetes bacterium]|nr:hypothetical protein [Armatimonadota bacterium]